MKRLHRLVVLLLFVLVSSVQLFSAGQGHPVFGSQIKVLDEQIKFLDERHIELGNLQEKYSSIADEIVKYDKLKDGNADAQYLKSVEEIVNLKITSLDSALKARVTSVKRLDLLYIVMLGLGSIIGISFAFYIVIMYNKRK